MLPNRNSYSSGLVTPRMTYYTRMIDNITGDCVLSWVSTSRVKDIFYGDVDGVDGGESQYIVE